MTQDSPRSFTSITFDPNVVLVLTALDHGFADGAVVDLIANTSRGVLGTPPYFPLAAQRGHVRTWGG